MHELGEGSTRIYMCRLSGRERIAVPCERCRLQLNAKRRETITKQIGDGGTKRTAEMTEKNERANEREGSSWTVVPPPRRRMLLR